MTHAQVAKNKDRYMAMQQNRDQKQFFMGQQTGHIQNLNSSAMSTGNAQG